MQYMLICALYAKVYTHTKKNKQVHTHVNVDRQRSTLAFAWLWLRLGATAEAHPADGHLGKSSFLAERVTREEGNILYRENGTWKLPHSNRVYIGNIRVL